jgi:hypothetical protein
VYRLWAHGEPNDAGGVEHCIYMHGRQYTGDATKRRSWGDHSCGDKMEFVCEIPTDFRMNTKRLDWQSAGGWLGGWGEWTGMRVVMRAWACEWAINQSTCMTTDEPPTAM